MNLAEISLAVLYTLVFPGFLFTAVVGLLLTWVDRKVTAVIQSRIGPPWFQPFADVGKLLSKRMIVPKVCARSASSARRCFPSWVQHWLP
jgi:NADH-quinone oxidoreductase subunit H